MDAVEYVVYWIVFVPLAALVVVFGTLTLAAIGLIVLWQWCFAEEKEWTSNAAPRSA